MIKRSTWILLVILLIVVAAYFVITKRASKSSSQATPTVNVNNFLITPADGTLQSLRISDRQGRVVQMQRDTSEMWTVTLPTSGTADQSLAGAAETQVGALRIVTTLNDNLNLADAGLDTPADVIELTFVSGAKHVIQVGTLTPTNSGYYIRYDGGYLYVVGKAGIDALINLLAAPPYAPTETSAPTSDLSFTPTIDLSTPTLELATPTP
jgi:hypothetical protein